MDDENPWEFDTVRGRSTSSIESFEPDSSLLTLLEDEMAGGQSTVRPPPISNVPATLRNLFDYGDPPPPEPFRMPTFDTPSDDPLLTNPSLNVSMTPARGRSPSRVGLATPEPTLGEDLRTAKQSSFIFPPKASTPRSKSSGGEQDENDLPPVSPVDRKRERLPPLGPGIPRMLAPAPTLADSDEKPPIPPSNKTGPSYREVRSTRGMPDIEIPAPSGVAAAADSPPPIVLSSSSPEQATRKLPVINRKRSQSSVAAPSTPRERNLATPDFRFPPVAPSPLSSERDPVTASPTPTFRLNHGHDRRSPTHSSVSTISTISTSSSIHQTSQSLDASILPKRLASPGGSLPTPPPIMRARSATATTESSPFAAAQNSIMNLKTPSRRPSLNRLASAPALDLPVRPFARSQDRSGSPAESTFNTSMGTPLPGLRDVLKVTHIATLKCALSDLCR